MKEITMQQHFQLVKDGKLKKEYKHNPNRLPRVYFRWQNGMITECKRVVVEKGTTVSEAAKTIGIKIELISKKDREKIITKELIIDLINE